MPKKGKKKTEEDNQPLPVVEHLLTEKEVDFFRASLLSSLRGPNDLFEFLKLKAGSVPHSHGFEAVREEMYALQAQGHTCRPIRGWRLKTISCVQRSGELFPLCWRAELLVILEVVRSNGSRRFTSVLDNSDVEDSGKVYMFYPSLAAHSEVSDVELLEDRRVWGFVLNSNYKQNPYVQDRLQSMRQLHIPCGTHALQVKSTDAYRHPPCHLFEQWAASRHPDHSSHRVAMALSLPSANERFDDEKTKKLVVEMILECEKADLDGGVPILKGTPRERGTKLFQLLLTIDACAKEDRGRHDPVFLQILANEQLDAHAKTCELRLGAWSITEMPKPEKPPPPPPRMRIARICSVECATADEGSTEEQRVTGDKQGENV